MDILIIILMVLALMLFIGSRYQLKRTKNRISAHDHMEEMRDGIMKYSREGLTRVQIIDAIMHDYGLEHHEAEYMYDRVEGSLE
ncbi:hypothetical protein [Salinicoccus cyprini]|uniref:hypothetical protein n=1 Tax=Salinicoccus cyprini TaxID=2493691 RepID=UPI0011A0F0D1|nr:hypothetical protein [Salinicoccus cyprini]